MRSLSDAEKMKIFKENEAAFLERMIDMKLPVTGGKEAGY